MSGEAERPPIQAPSTYQDWLTCLSMMRVGSGADGEVFAAAARGSFAGSDLAKAALQRQIVETVNAFLDRSVRRFLRNLNENIEFNELFQTELLFKRLKRDVSRSLFFTSLPFLRPEFRAELEESVKAQMSGFWADTLRFLRGQSLEFSNSELEDVLFLVRRIRLF